MQHSEPVLPTEPTTLWNRSFVIVLLTGIFTSMSSYMILPLISKYAISLGASLPLAGSIASIMSIAALISRPFSGVVADRFNRKHLTIWATLLAAVAIAACAFADAILPIVIIRTIHGFAFSLMTVSSMALASSLVPGDKLGEGMGYLGLGTILASAIGPGIGLMISEQYGYSACFLISAGFMLIGAVAMLAVPNHYVPIKRQGRQRIRLKHFFASELMLYMLILGLFSCGNGLISTYLALLGDERGIANIALFFTAYSIMMVVIRPFVGVLLDKKGLSIIMYPALALATFGMVLLGSATTIWMVTIASVLKALGQGAGTPSIQAYSIKLIGKERAGVASSTCYIGQDIGNSIAPIIGGFVAVQYGYAQMFYGYAAILLLLGTALYAWQHHRERRGSNSNIS